MAKWTEEQRRKFAATMAQKSEALSAARGHKPRERKSPAKGKRTYVRKAEAQDHIQEHAAYLFGRFENEVEHYSRSNDIPFSALAERVASLFRHPKGR